MNKGRRKEIKLCPLSEAVINNDVAGFYEMLPGISDVDELDYNSVTPLYYAVLYDRLEMAEALLEKGADIEFRDEYANTPLMKACNPLKLDMINLLLLHGADVNAANCAGITPKKLAQTSMGFPEIDAFKD